MLGVRMVFEIGLGSHLCQTVPRQYSGVHHEDDRAYVVELVPIQRPFPIDYTLSKAFVSIVTSLFRIIVLLQVVPTNIKQLSTQSE